MIVTRRRRRRAHPGRVLIPLLIIVVLGGLVALPPVNHALANGPLRPVFVAAGDGGRTLARPLTFAAQQQTITDRNREIRSLDAELEAQRKIAAAADTKIQQLQRQLAAAADQPRATGAPVAVAVSTPAPAGAFATAPTVADATDDKRLAATWAAMEPEKAAALVQRLPDAQVDRVMAQMDPDSAGAILDAMPPAAAARISRAAAQLRTASDR